MNLLTVNVSGRKKNYFLSLLHTGTGSTVQAGRVANLHRFNSFLSQFDLINSSEFVLERSFLQTVIAYLYYSVEKT